MSAGTPAACDLRLVTGFKCKDGDAKDTTLELLELEGAIRLTICQDAVIILTTAQADYLSRELDRIVVRVDERVAS